MIPVIMSGGSGTRLWPLSRVQWPKQFCELFEQSLMSLTLQRVMPLGAPRVLTSETLKQLTQRALKLEGLSSKGSLFEPSARNTAPAIAFLLKTLLDEGMGNEIIGVFPADQLIEKESEFQKAVQEATRLAGQGQIVTLGIRPTEANTGYGYIELSGSRNGQGHPVLKFHEKPNQTTAEAFLKTGNFVWNAGIFIFQVSVMAAAFQRLQPEMWSEISKLKADLSNLAAVYANLKPISIDYAIAEKLTAQELSCVPCDIGWSDVGSWDAVAEISQRRTQKAESKVVEVGAKGNFVYSQGQKTYAVVGEDNLIIVDTADALLIAKKGKSQDVKAVVEQLAKNQNPVIQQHNFEKRPWGEFEVLRDTERFKSKVIQVEPGQQLSLQSHARREEHWVVTLGAGEVVLNEQTIPVKSGTYVHIPLGAKHRMRNNGSTVLEFIEVQVGSYFGEDDIVRYQDDYKRT